MYFRHAPLAKIRSSASKKTPTPPLPRTCGGRDCASDVYGMIMARAARVAADNFIGIPLNGRARIGGGNGSGFREVAAALAAGEGTAWLWARTEMAGAVDVLVIVEAGQMSRANGGGRRVCPATDEAALDVEPGASTAVAAVRFRARLAGEPSAAGERTARILGGYRRTASDRGRGQTRGFGAADLAAVLATCHRPRRGGRGVESDPVARERGRLDAVIAGLLFMAGMRRSEVSALHSADVADAADGGGVLVTVRRSKTNQEGETTDVRFVKGGVARAIRTIRAAASPAPADRVAVLSDEFSGCTTL